MFRLSTTEQLLFIALATMCLSWAAWLFYRIYKTVLRGQPAPEPRHDNLPSRIGRALWLTLAQTRIFRNRPVVSALHAGILLGFVYYLLVNLVDALEGFFAWELNSETWYGAMYNLTADLLTAAILVGVVALWYRRFFTRVGKKTFAFNPRTLLHEAVQGGKIRSDSLIVSGFITFHVGARLLHQAHKLLQHPDPFQPVASSMAALLATLGPGNNEILVARHLTWWAALGSILLFLPYFVRSKHIHIAATPIKYTFERHEGTGVLPPMNLEGEHFGAAKLEDLAWPRLLDAYACIQCNRCQDVCPASTTGKALSPAALEINKRMELNALTGNIFELKQHGFFDGAPSPRPLLEFAINEESLWACTTCGACMQVCPVGTEQMLDIVDIRRERVMMQGEFPKQLQTAFAGMERHGNPWGISSEKRMDWAEGLHVPTTAENPNPDVLYWVGCAASYDPSAQKVARSFVQLLQAARVNFAVLGKRESCTGDSARRAGNEYLYVEMASKNVETLNRLQPKLIVATCPHCMNNIGNEYKQLGGDYTVVHHTQYLETLIEQNQLQAGHFSDGRVAYHDPCYLGRHNGVFEAPRQTLAAMGLEILELERSRENSFCCGAGGAQFWKEEEAGTERISDNRFAEIKTTLTFENEKTVAVGCPFCKSMFASTPQAQDSGVVVKDVAELLLENLEQSKRTLGSSHASGDD